MDRARPCPHTVRPRGKRGFSLLELMVVLAVLALLAALVVPAIRPPGPRVVLTGLGQDLVRAAAAARLQAIRTGRITRLDVDLAQRRVLADGLPVPLVLPEDMTLEVKAVHQTNAGPTMARVLFYPNGQSSGGSLTLAQAGVTVRVTINWITGHAAAQTPP
ncbi:MAG: GspH/FimT family pseudopilin [Alphaproteobacteria bacterium]